MASPIFGEFVGTFILILLGDGVVAGVLLKGSKGENAGWLAITSGWAFAVFAGVFTAIACGSRRRAPESRGDARRGRRERRFQQGPAVLRCATRGGVPRRGRRVDPLPAALGVDGGQESEARHVLHHPRDSPRRRQPGERGDWHVRADAGGWPRSSRGGCRRRGLPPASDRSSSAVSCGASACRLAARRVMRSTRHAISARAWRTPCYRLRASAIRIGATPRFRSLAR